MTSNEDIGRGRPTRRKILKTSSLAGLAGLAGCAGGQDDTDGQDGGETTDQQTNQSGASQNTSQSQDEVDLSGTTFEFWDTFNVQSRSAADFLQGLVANFEQSTGASVSTNWTGYGDVIGSKWITNFKNDNYPHLFTSVANWNGRFSEGGWVVPFTEYRDELPDETLEQIEWIFPLYNNYIDQMWEGMQSVPFALQMIGPMIARMDHFEEAGLDPKNDFPPDDWEHAIEVGQTLQEQGPGEYGYQILNGPFDEIDIQLASWTIADGGEDGLLLTQDNSDVLFDNDVWKRNMRRFVETYREYGLSNPNTPQQVDEELPQLLASGQVSMTNIESPMHPALQSQVGEMYENGTIKWAPSWGGSSGQKGYIYPQSLAINQKAPNESQSKYEKRREASIEMIKVFLSKPVQEQMHELAGVLPIRKDVWEELPSTDNNVFSSWKEIANSVQIAHQNHPQYVELMFNIPGPYATQAIKGEITPDEACEQSAADARDLLGM
jgi:ABC-type glycerol-3-phosphate transport system substrate-binding protein